MATTLKPFGAKERADSIADLVSEACEKLVELADDWFALNDKAGLAHAHRMLESREVTLMLSARVDDSGLSHVALNLLRTETPMPRPYFEIQVPMLPWKLGRSRTPDEAASLPVHPAFNTEVRRR
ncbi:MAG: hypothetical protein ABIR52_05315 [Casimicrobiaceae bacterium]